MSFTSSNPRVNEMHALYVRLTGLELRLDYAREAAWAHWLEHGWGQDQLVAVVRYIRQGMVNKRRSPEALNFSALIVATDRFEEQLLMARQAYRRGQSRSRPTADVEVRDVSGAARLVPPSEQQLPDPVPISGALEAAKLALGWRPTPETKTT